MSSDDGASGATGSTTGGNICSARISRRENPLWFAYSQVTVSCGVTQWPPQNSACRPVHRHFLVSGLPGQSSAAVPEPALGGINCGSWSDPAQRQGGLGRHPVDSATQDLVDSRQNLRRRSVFSRNALLQSEEGCLDPSMGHRCQEQCDQDAHDHGHVVLATVKDMCLHEDQR